MTSRVVLLLCFVASMAAQAKQEMSATDEKLLSGYTLSMDKLQRYQSAIAKMDAACKSDPVLREQSEAMKPGETFEQVIQRVGGTKVYKSYLKPAGLDAQDVVLLPVVLMGAGAVVEAHADQSKLKGLSDAQVAFYRAHRDAISKLKLTGECESDSEE